MSGGQKLKDQVADEFLLNIPLLEDFEDEVESIQGSPKSSLLSPRMFGASLPDLNSLEARPRELLIGPPTKRQTQSSVRKLLSKHGQAPARVLICTPAGDAEGVCPFVLFSTLGVKGDENRRKRKQRPETLLETFVRSHNAKAVSYGHLLNEKGTAVPFLLDNPDLRSGKHRVVVTLPGFMETVIAHVKQKDLKRELNEQFRNTHPWLDKTGLTLSQIRKMKKLLLAAGRQIDLEISTVALAVVYFEKLICLNVVTKANKNIIAGVAMLLAFKFNEFERSSREGGSRIVLRALEKVLGSKPRDILCREFAAFVSLGFSLYIPKDVVDPHFRELCRTVEVIPQVFAMLQID